MQGRKWTQGEIDFLKEHSEVGDAYLAKKLNRTINSIKDKRRVLNIHSGQMGIYMPEVLTEQEKLARIYKMAADLGIKIGVKE